MGQISDIFLSDLQKLANQRLQDKFGISTTVHLNEYTTGHVSVEIYDASRGRVVTPRSTAEFFFSNIAEWARKCSRDPSAADIPFELHPSIKLEGPAPQEAPEPEVEIK